MSRPRGEGTLIRRERPPRLPYSAHLAGVRGAGSSAPGTGRLAVLPRQHLDHQRRASVPFLQVRLAGDERLELLDTIEDRLDSHPGALPVSMKRGNSILTGDCPGRRSLLSRPIHRLLTHPQILRESRKRRTDAASRTLPTPASVPRACTADRVVGRTPCSASASRSGSRRRASLGARSAAVVTSGTRGASANQFFFLSESRNCLSSSAGRASLNLSSAACSFFAASAARPVRSATFSGLASSGSAARSKNRPSRYSLWPWSKAYSRHGHVRLLPRRVPGVQPLAGRPLLAAELRQEAHAVGVRRHVGTDGLADRRQEVHAADRGPRSPAPS